MAINVLMSDLPSNPTPQATDIVPGAKAPFTDGTSVKTTFAQITDYVVNAPNGVYHVINQIKNQPNGILGLNSDGSIEVDDSEDPNGLVATWKNLNANPIGITQDFKMLNLNNAEYRYAEIQVQALNRSVGSEQGTFNVFVYGPQFRSMSLSPQGMTLNRLPINFNGSLEDAYTSRGSFGFRQVDYGTPSSTYVISRLDDQKTKVFTSSAVIICANNPNIDIGWKCTFISESIGPLNFTADSGVTIRSYPTDNALTSNGQGARVLVEKIAENTYKLSGDLTGTGLNGIYPISISGSAANAENANTAATATNATNAFNASNCSRSVNASGLLTGGGPLTSNVSISLLPRNIYSQTFNFNVNPGITNYTLLNEHVNSFITVTGTVNSQINIPTDAEQSIPVGAYFTITNLTGNNDLFLSISANPGVNLINRCGNASVGNTGFIRLQKTASNTWTILEIYEKYTSLGNQFTGCFATPVNAEYEITRINSFCGWDVPADVIGPASAAGSQMNVLQNIPARFRPLSNKTVSILIRSNTSQTTGRLNLASNTGFIQIGASITNGNFATTGTNQLFSGCSVNWFI